MSEAYALQMPSSYVLMDNDEMEYLDGGFAVSKNVFKWTVSAIVTTGMIALGGGISYAGLKTVLGSMSLKNQLIRLLVKGIGKLGIAGGNALASKFGSGLAGCIAGDFLGNVFTRYIDPLDGRVDDKIKIW